MALVLADRVLETTTVAGTGAATLGGAQANYQPFSVIGDGSTTYYTIVDNTNNQWEVGVGTYTLSSNSISRDTVLSSSNGGSLVFFGSGDKDIFLDLPSEAVLLSAGDVTGPASAVANNFAAFNMTTGKLIKDSGYNATSFATAAQGTLADTAIQPGDLGTAAYLDAGSANGVATLDAGGKVPTSQIPQMGDLNYQGTWNATTNTPTLTSSAGTKGFYYVVSVAGSTNLNGITDWKVGDWAVFNGSVWEKIDNTDAVTSVNGFTGTVVLTTTDIAEGTNEYFTTAKARASVSAGTGISYDSGTGVITNSSPSLGGDVVGPSSATDNAIARFDTTTGKLLQNSVVTVSDTGAIAGATTITDLNYLDFNTAYATTLGAGQLGWNGNDTLGLGMIGGNVVQHIGEDTFFYVKASATITKGQLCMFTGTVGSSGVLTAAPSTAIPYAEAIIGVAAENIANNAFGLIQNLGTLRGVDTSAFLDGDILYYNSAVTGGFTKTFPTSGPIVVAAAVGKAGSGGSGVLIVRVSFQTRVTASTGISVTQGNDAVTVTNSAPDQTVAITGAGGAVVTGTYPNFTITTPSGTVTSVTGTAPIASTGGATPAISISQATTSTDGYLSSTDWNTFNNKQPAGSYLTTVTASTPLSGSGTVGSPLIISQATTSTDGYLSSTDWNTFNGKGSVSSVGGTGTVNGITLTGTVTSTGNLTLGGTLGGIGNSQLTNSAVTIGSTAISLGATSTTLAGLTSVSSTDLTASNAVTGAVVSATNGLMINSLTISASYSIPSGYSASSTGPITVSSGVTVTVPSGSRWVVL